MAAAAALLTASIAGIALGLALLGLAYHLHQQRLAREREAAAWHDRETGINIERTTGPIPYGERRETAWRITLANTSARPRVAVIELRNVPHGWRAATNLPRLPLSPGERATLSIHIAPDPSIPPGTTATITIAARAEEAREHAATTTLECTAPDHDTAPTRRTIVLRDNANATKPRLRT